MAKKKFIVIDGNSVIHRAFHALPPLTNKRGEAIGAVYGFMLAFFKAAEDFDPDCVAVCFDSKGGTFRNKEFEGYKSQRPATPPDLVSQIYRIQDLLKGLGVSVFAKEGYEADDLIATVINKACQGRAGECDFYVLTGDYDSLQLVSDNVRVMIITRGIKNAVLFDTAKVKEVFGVTPGQIPALKALAGDSSDNIPGAPGIGKKTAVDIMQEYSSLEDMYGKLESDPQGFTLKGRNNNGKVKEILVANKETVMKFKRLTTMDNNAPIKADANICVFGKLGGSKHQEVLLEAGLKSLAARLEKNKTSRNGTLF